ncbi:MAG: tRNA lysidine(34) synthetase TilS [Dehalococcoidia bacterium]|nr:tRNA lysidine(34) synthetase TilS [Dehalococcoidia bacterium]
MSGDVYQRVETFFRQCNLLGSRLVVAVSGGSDSVCLLHILAILKNELGLSLHVAHLDHMLRGEESRADAEYVTALACQMGLAADIGQVDVHSLRREHKLTLEEAAREARYLFLAQVADKYGTDLIVTGHTQNDWVETVLLHIIRGSGLRGLAGLQPIISRTIKSKQVKIVRPMLDIKRKETHSYCRSQNLSPRLDSSNLDAVPMRNKIRLKFLPLLETYNPNITETLLCLSSAAGDEMACMDKQVAQLTQQAIAREGNVITLDKRALGDVHPVLLRYLLRNCLREFPCGLRDIESVHLESMLALMSKPAGRQLSLPHGLLFLTGYNCYWLGRKDDLPCPFPHVESHYKLLVPGFTSLCGWKVETSIVKTIDVNNNPMVAYIDIDVVGEELWVRGCQRGDFFYPLGLGSAKKLGEFMIDAHIPKLWRKRIPVVAAPMGILWLMGYRLDERAKVTAQTRSILRLEFQRV